MNKKIYLLLICFCISICGCHQTASDTMQADGRNQVQEDIQVKAHIAEKSGFNETDNWINAYLDILSSDEFLCEEYALAYVNEDNIPELIGNNQGAWYQLYSCTALQEGMISEMLPYGTYSREYFYLPRKNSIVSTCTGIGGRGIYEEYYILNESGLVHDMTIGNLPPAEDDIPVYDSEENNIWTYEKDGITISEDEWKELSEFDENYINLASLKYYSREETDLKEIIMNQGGT